MIMLLFIMLSFSRFGLMIFTFKRLSRAGTGNYMIRAAVPQAPSVQLYLLYYDYTLVE